MPASSSAGGVEPAQGHEHAEAVAATERPRVTRTRSALDAVAEDYVAAVVALSPITATALGIPGADDKLDDFSPAGLAAAAELDADTLRRLDGLEPVDDVDRVTLEAMRERLGVAAQSYAAGIPHMSLNVLASPLQAVRDILDLMPTATARDWDTIAARTAAIPTALRQWHESLLVARERGLVAPRRQVLACLEQARGFAGDDGYFSQLVAGAGLSDAPGTEGPAGPEEDSQHPPASSKLPAATRARLEAGAQAARAGYADCVRRLTADILPAAPEADACGRELYALHSRAFLGAEVDLAETYAWGQAELARILAEKEQVSRQILAAAGGGHAGADVDADVDTDASPPRETVSSQLPAADPGVIAAAAALLDADPAYRLDGTAALQSWMQERADEAVTALAGTHFDIPQPLRRIECRIAPTQTGGIYYTGPSDDLSRPGQMWWSVPKGVTTHATWQELTTVYHEGVPGHHLQVGQAVFNSAHLNRWRRLLSWTSGHGEGWALYAERFMAELGFMADPGNRLGLLDGQSLRAARVVIDIGVHCDFEAPASVGGGAWTYDKAWALLNTASLLSQEVLRFELDRYLGWPGQAPAYKVGERLWLDLRAEARRRDPEEFDLREFHRRALDIGGVGLDTLRRAVLQEWVA
ncbi:MAG: DUF885 domain-containing protein [Micrococcales bacterium]|nr:DUF885 domain-containing protein [Micrococcales bacterium]